MNIEVSGVKIELTPQQLKQINEQVNKKTEEDVTDLLSLCRRLDIHPDKLLPYGINAEDEFEQYVNACVIIAKVAEVYNEGTILDWSNTNQYKYLPYEYWAGGSRSVFFYAWYAYRSTSGRSYFKSEELARKAYDNFKEYYEIFWKY